jgi:DNA invertase Pin-like site-specific DNA recombinase
MERIAVCYGYGRHSTAKQEMTREAQEFRVTEYYERNLRPHGVRWGGFFYDAATSARVPFSERESGRVVHAVACPGDHIVVAKLDRPFRSLRDGVVSMEQWNDRGVNFHSLDLQVDTSTPMGRFFRTILLAVAELEREFARERTTETALARQRMGLPHSRGCPVGWKIVGSGAGRRYKADEDERTLIDAMAGMKEEGYGNDDIALWGMRQKLYPNKRIFPTRGQVRACLNARRLGYPKVTNYKMVNRMARRGSA